MRPNWRFATRPTTTPPPRLGRRLQLLYRTLADNEAWATAVLDGVDPAIADDVASNWSARQHLSALVTSTKLADDLPAWRIDEPVAAEELLAAYHAAEDATGVPWEILASINFIETRMGRIEGLSTAGAVGPMQFLPSTWEGCCEGDPTVDADAIRGAAVYLTLVGAPDDIDAALFSYNHSTDYVEAVKAYAEVMERNELAYRGYHAYEVFFRSSAGLVVLRPGYEEPEPVDAAAWIEAHPGALISD
ncbi:MAG: lytic transglycosylase domain-containing protein [Acidimicrobiales bacterium]